MRTSEPVSSQSSVIHLVNYIDSHTNMNIPIEAVAQQEESPVVAISSLVPVRRNTSSTIRLHECQLEVKEYTDYWGHSLSSNTISQRINSEKRVCEDNEELDSFMKCMQNDGMLLDLLSLQNSELQTYRGRLFLSHYHKKAVVVFKGMNQRKNSGCFGNIFN